MQYGQSSSSTMMPEASLSPTTLYRVMSVCMHRVWPPEAGLPEPILPRPWWKPGVVGVLRVLPLQRPPLGVGRGV